MHISTLLWNIMTCWPFSRLFCCDLSSVERALDQRNSGINPSTVKHITWLRAAALKSPASQLHLVVNATARHLVVMGSIPN
jgi:hypothetical protein